MLHHSQPLPRGPVIRHLVELEQFAGAQIGVGIKAFPAIHRKLPAPLPEHHHGIPVGGEDPVIDNCRLGHGGEGYTEGIGCGDGVRAVEGFSLTAGCPVFGGAE